jgi:hypothetical protein
VNINSGANPKFLSFTLIEINVLTAETPSFHIKFHVIEDNGSSVTPLQNILGAIARLSFSSKRFDIELYILDVFCLIQIPFIQHLDAVKYCGM